MKWLVNTAIFNWKKGKNLKILMRFSLTTYYFCCKIKDCLPGEGWKLLYYVEKAIDVSRTLEVGSLGVSPRKNDLDHVLQTLANMGGAFHGKFVTFLGKSRG